MRRTTTRKPRVAKTTKRLCDKWIIGMVGESLTEPTIKMFGYPKTYTDYDSAVRAAEEFYRRWGKPFVVFAKVCVIGPSRPPVMKTEFSA